MAATHDTRRGGQKVGEDNPAAGIWDSLSAGLRGRLARLSGSSQRAFTAVHQVRADCEFRSASAIWLVARPIPLHAGSGLWQGYRSI